MCMHAILIVTIGLRRIRCRRRRCCLLSHSKTYRIVSVHCSTVQHRMCVCIQTRATIVSSALKKVTFIFRSIQASKQTNKHTHREVAEFYLLILEYRC